MEALAIETNDLPTENNYMFHSFVTNWHRVKKTSVGFMLTIPCRKSQTIWVKPRRKRQGLALQCLQPCEAKNRDGKTATWRPIRWFFGCNSGI